MVQGGIGGYFLICINKENEQLTGLLLQCVVEFLLLQAPAFAGKTFYPVTVYGMREPLRRGAKADLYGIFTERLIYLHIHYAVGKNRKRFSFAKKRFNEFSAF
ncbi:hypothetical protein Cpin_1056 [Chitinophaga pinensis DSM 2588]|uniref:Uncharacterized protein n=1 Tax=Chitinophaga pinensis (strain ATCC 43595 / DSM 2588 / LMG 13176 / NBRC 15968 / NCIMB 11800 / UQM 2034) TaxID=485918 RepID=A0A979G0G6_CHIPD|nr:hypothetical protein Cpin_1056 [Chitinophaga pinensis DSM 2588]